MEQKVMEQIDKAYEIYVEKGIALDKRYRTLKEEIFTDEIKDMIKVLYEYDITEMYLDCYIDSEYECFRKITFCKYLDYLNYGLWINDRSYPSTPSIKKMYTSDCIRDLEKGTKDLKENTILMNILEEQAKNLVEYIAMKYKEISEEQTDRLANILSELDYEDEPIKHIKVTVEWI